jgi:hypothetical protein
VSEIILVLNKVLVKEFYRLNAGFFLVIIALTFGFMSGVEHRALAEFFIASPVVLMIPIVVWIIYSFKIINFNRQQLLREENRFVYDVALLSSSKQWMAFSVTVICQSMPVLLYGVFLILIAAKHSLFTPILQVTVAVAVLLFLSVIPLIKQVNNPVREIKITGLKKFLDYRLTKSIAQFYIEWILRREPALLIGTKIFSGILLFAVTQLYKGESYDWRLLAMGTTIAFSGNFMLISQLHRFENFHFAFLRNIPLSLLQRFFLFIGVFLILCFPEIIILIRNFPVTLDWFSAIEALLFGISIGVIFYSAHFINAFHEKDFTRIIFGGVIGWVLLILFSIPLTLLTLINLGLGSWLYRKYFYGFEYSSVDKA